MNMIDLYEKDMPLINIVLGPNIKEDGSNIICNFVSPIIPRIGETISITKIGGLHIVKDIIYDYKHIDKYSHDDIQNRGSVYVWVFI